jgi:hypothetical protein
VCLTGGHVRRARHDDGASVEVIVDEVVAVHEQHPTQCRIPDPTQVDESRVIVKASRRCCALVID